MLSEIPKTFKLTTGEGMIQVLLYGDWTITEDRIDNERANSIETVFTVANGYMGVRGLHEEGFPGERSGTYIAGVFDRASGPDQVTELVNLPNWLGIRLEIENRPVRLDQVGVTSYFRCLDMKRGVLSRGMTIRDDAGRLTRIESLRYVSLQRFHVGVIRYRVVPMNYSGKIVVTSTIDANVDNGGRWHISPYELISEAPDSVTIAVTTLQSQIRIAHAMGCKAALCAGKDVLRAGQNDLCADKAVLRSDLVKGPTSVGLRYEFAEVGPQGCEVVKFVASATSRDPDIIGYGETSEGRRGDGGSAGLVDEAAGRLLREALDAGEDRLLEEHASEWAGRWSRCDIEIDGPVFDQTAVRFAMFHALQTAHPSDETVSLAAKGLHGEGYKGHVFWDMEIFNLPLFSLCFPETGRRLLSYRYWTLPGARKKALDNGYRGAMYAWESADTGEETTPKWTAPDPNTGERKRIWCGDSEQHISSDVSYAIWRYYLASGDTAFMLDRGAEIIVDTARFWSSRATWDESRNAFGMKSVIGPDEYHENIDNNVFANAMARWNMEKALELLDWVQTNHPEDYRRLKERLNLADQDVDMIRTVSSAMYVGDLDRDTPVIEQFEGYYQAEDRALKQPDVLMLAYMLPELFDRDRLMANWSFYEPITAHGSSLSPSIHSIVASRLGLQKEAYEYFLMSAGIDLTDKMGNSADGIHMASLGGTWQAVVIGFGGVSIDADGLSISPAIPEQWRSFSFRLTYRETPISVAVDRDGVVVKVHGESDSVGRIRSVGPIRVEAVQPLPTV